MKHSLTLSIVALSTMLAACSAQPSTIEGSVEETPTPPAETMQPGSTATGSENQEESTGISATQEFTLGDIAAHNSEQSCYTAINGSVYNITSYIPFHKGGKRDIMKVCGRDGTSLFSRQHGGQAEPEQTLAQFYIGTLVQ